MTLDSFQMLPLPNIRPRTLIGAVLALALTGCGNGAPGPAPGPIVDSPSTGNLPGTGTVPGRGTETGNGFTTLTLGLESSDTGAAPAVANANGLRDAQATALSGLDAQGTPFTLQRVMLTAARIDLVATSSNACAGYTPPANQAIEVRCEDQTVRLVGPIVIDPIDGSSTPSLENLTLPTLTFERIDVQFRADGGADWMVAAGAFEREGESTPFDLSLKRAINARFEQAGGFTLDPALGNDVMLLLDVAKWFDGLPLTDCLDAGDLPARNGRVPLTGGRGACAQVDRLLADAIRKSGRLDHSARP